jgi:hypothetical protein
MGTRSVSDISNSLDSVELKKSLVSFFHGDEVLPQITYLTSLHGVHADRFQLQ